jgi:hypothetical protein
MFLPENEIIGHVRSRISPHQNLVFCLKSGENFLTGDILTHCEIWSTALECSNETFYSSYHGFRVKLEISCNSKENLDIIKVFLHQFKFDMIGKIVE